MDALLVVYSAAGVLISVLAAALCIGVMSESVCILREMGFEEVGYL